jgi:nucleobase:cation symporter-1, NCS1 family
VDERAPSWGIEPVPERLRVLGGLDLTLLWANLGVSLLVLVAGTYLVPALSLQEALVAILVGGVIGNAMLGLAGLIGAQARVPAMVLLRAPLGRGGSYVASGLNVLQNLGWATFELIVIATAAAAVSQEVFGWSGRWLWTLVFGAATTVLALLGPVALVRRLIRRFAVWAVLASLVYLTWWAVDRADVGGLWSQPGEGGLTFWQGVDLMVVLPVSWLPLAADYTRFARGRAGAFWGTSLGYFVPNVWLYLLGAVLVLHSAGLGDTTTLLATVAAGGVAGIVALVALAVDETDEPFANVYSTAVSVQNVAPQLPQRPLIVAVSALATGGALLIELGRYLDFLYLLGSLFVPLFGVLLADWLLARGYGRAEIFGAPRLRLAPCAAWLVGFALYQWLHPVGPDVWTDLVERTQGRVAGSGATLPSFVCAFALTAMMGWARWVRPTADRVPAR